MKLDKIWIFMEPYDYNYRGQGFYIYPFSFSSWDNFQDGLKESYENYPPEVEEWEFVDADYIADWCMDGYGISEDNWEAVKEIVEFGSRLGMDVDDSIGIADYLGTKSADYLEEAYIGEYDSIQEYAYDLLDDIGISEELAERYFDWDALGLALVANGDVNAIVYDDWEDRYDSEAEAEAEYERILDMRYSEIAEWYVYDLVGDLESALGKEIKTYFNYKSFARDLEYDGYVLSKSHLWLPQ